MSRTRAGVVVHTITPGGFCSVCGEVAEWLIATDAQLRYLDAD